MLSHTISRFRRAPLSALGVLLFAAMLAAVLCGLQAANEAEIANYEQVRHTIPVPVTVTNLTGTYAKEMELPAWVISVFRGDDGTIRPNFKEYVKDVKIRSSYPFSADVGMGELVGITDIAAAEELQEDIVTIDWKPGYNEEMFFGGEQVCLVPWGMAELETLRMEFIYEVESYTAAPVEPEIRHTCCEFTVAGTYFGGSGAEKTLVFCPWSAMPPIYKGLKLLPEADAISAVLIDNDQIEEFREIANSWFAEPNITGTYTPWHYFTYTYYDHFPYALDINETMLRKAADTMEASIAMNQVAAVLVFALSAGAGFFVGFLMIRSRKKEIALMRTLGTPNISVYLGFILEQMLCILAGAALGGWYFHWQPFSRLGLFAGIYFVGLSMALVIFLNEKLISTLKEEE